MTDCRTCGTDIGGQGAPEPENCPSCPPTLCDECGGVNHWGTDDLCSCWVSTEDMSIGEMKALFAHDDLSVDPEITRSGVQCGNPGHPDGPWHIASPVPPTWERRETFRQWRRKRRYGCGCAVTG